MIEIENKLCSTFSFIKRGASGLYLSIADYINPDIMCDYENFTSDAVIDTCSEDEYLRLCLNIGGESTFASTSECFSDNFYFVLLDNGIKIRSVYFEENGIYRKWIIRNIVNSENGI